MSDLKDAQRDMSSWIDSSDSAEEGGAEESQTPPGAILAGGLAGWQARGVGAGGLLDAASPGLILGNAASPGLVLGGWSFLVIFGCMFCDFRCICLWGGGWVATW